MRDLLKECVKMYELDHPNVLGLIGVCLDGGPAPYIVMPFMENGSLLSHLKAERESIVLDPDCSNLDDIVSTNNGILTSSYTKQLIQFLATIFPSLERPINSTPTLFCNSCPVTSTWQ